MKSNINLILLGFSFLLFGCKETNSPTELESKNNSAVRSWKGDNYEIFTYQDSSWVVKDIVIEYTFNNDGSCTLSQGSYSVRSISGQWAINSDFKSIVITLARPNGKITETLSILELSESRFIFGDTTSHGYSLIPK